MREKLAKSFRANATQLGNGAVLVGSLRAEPDPEGWRFSDGKKIVIVPIDHGVETLIEKMSGPAAQLALDIK